MKATLAVCADRAVGFGAALLGCAFLYSAARHLATPLVPPNVVAYAPAIPSSLSREVAVARARISLGPHTASVNGRSHVARTIVRTTPGTFRPRIAHAPGVTRASLAVTIRSAKRARPIVRIRSRSPGTRVAVRSRPSRRGSSIHAKGVRVIAARRPATRTPRVPARFDTRPALVLVSDASPATLPEQDPLPTLDVRKRRR